MCTITKSPFSFPIFTKFREKKIVSNIEKKIDVFNGM